MTTIWVSLGVAVPMVGASGVVRGTDAPEPDGSDIPAAFVAVTVTEYSVPLDSPVIVHSRSPVVQPHVFDVVPSDAVAV